MRVNLVEYALDEHLRRCVSKSVRRSGEAQMAQDREANAAIVSLSDEIGLMAVRQRGLMTRALAAADQRLIPVQALGLHYVIHMGVNCFALVR